MAVDNLDFKVKIDTKQATKNLGGLQRSLNKFNKEAAVFIKQIDKVSKGFAKLNKSTTGIDKNIQSATKAMRAMNRTTKTVDKSITSYNKAMDSAVMRSKFFAKSFGKVAGSMKAVGKSAKTLEGPLKGVTALMRGQKAVTTTSKGLKKETKNLSGGFSGLAAKTITLNQAMELFHKTMQAVRAISAFTAGNFAIFEQDLVGVAKTADLSAEETHAMGLAIQELSTRVPVAQSALLKFGEAAGQLGVKGGKNLLNFADTMAKVEVATNLTGEEAALGFTRILNTTQTSIDKIDEFSSVIIKLGNNFADQESGILRTANVIAQGIGTNFGASADEVAALAAASRDMGIRFELAGSAITRSMVEINKIVSAGGAPLNSFASLLGQTGDQVVENFGEKPLKVFRRFLRALSKVDRIQIPQILEQFKISGVEVLRVIPTLAKGIGTVDRAFSIASREMNLTSEEMETVSELARESGRAFDTLGSDMKITQNVIKNIGIDIGRTLAPSLREAEKSLRSTVMSLRVFVAQLTFAIQQIDFKALGDSLKKIGKAIGIIIGLKFGPALLGFLAPLGLVAAKFIVMAAAVTATAGALVVIMNNLDRMDDLLATIGGAFLTWVEFISGAFRELGFFIITEIRKIVQGLQGGGLDKVLKKFGISIEEIEKNLAKTQKSLAKNIKLSREELDGLIEDTKKSAAKLDLSFFTTIASEMEKFLVNLKKVPKGFKLSDAEAKAFAKTMEGAFVPQVDAVEATREVKKLLSDINKLHEDNLDHQNKLADLAEFRVFLLNTQLDEMEKQLGKAGKLNKLLDGTNQTFQQILDTAREVGAEKIEGSLFDFRLRPLAEDVSDMAVRFKDASKNAFELFQTMLVMKGAGAETNFLPDTADIKAFGVLIRDTLSDIKLPTLADIGQSLKDAGPALLDAGIEMAKSFGNALLDIDFGKVFKGIGKFMKGAGSFITSILDPKNINKLADALDNFIEKLPMLLTQAFSRMIKSLDKFIKKLPEVVKSLLAALPGVIKEIMKALPALVDAFADALVMIIDALPAILQSILDGLPEVINRIMDRLPEIITRLFEAIPVIIVQILRALPEIIEGIMERLPEIISALTEGLIGATGEIIAGFIQFMLSGGAEKIVGAIIRGIIRSIGALVSGIWKGLQRAFTAIFSGKTFKFPEIISPDQIQEQLDSVSKAFTEVSDKLFNVIDLKAEARGVDMADRLNKIFSQGISRFVMKMRGLVDIFIEAWRALVNTVGDWFGARGLEIWNGFLKPIGKWFSEKGGAIWNGFKEAVGKAVAAIKKIGGRIWEGLKEGLGQAAETFMALGRNIFTGLANALGDLGEKLLELGSKIWEGLRNGLENAPEKLKAAGTKIWNGLSEGVGQAVETFKQLGSDIWEGLRESVEGVGEAFSKLGGQIWGGLTTGVDNVGETFKKLGTSIWDALQEGVSKPGAVFGDLGNKIWEGLKTGLGSVGTVIDDALKTLDPSNLFDKIFSIPDSAWGSGDIEGALGFDMPFMKFADGGVVPGKALKKGDHEANDRVVAMLSPGEAIIPRSLMENPFIQEFVARALDGSLKNFAEGGIFGQVADQLKKSTGLDVASLDPTQFDFSKLDPTQMDFSGMTSEDLGKTVTRAMSDAIAGIQNGAEALKKMLADVGKGLFGSDNIVKLLKNKFGEFFKKMLSANAIGTSDGAPGLIVPPPFIPTLPASMTFKEPIKPPGTLAVETGPAEGTIGLDVPTVDEAYAKAAAELGMTVEQYLQWLATHKFNAGGLVPGVGSRDSVPSMLTPGEFVMNAGSVKKFGSDFFQQLNNGGNGTGSMMGDTNITLNLDFKTTKPIDEDMVRQRIVPAVKREIRRASQSGELVVSKRGVF